MNPVSQLVRSCTPFLTKLPNLVISFLVLYEHGSESGTNPS
jgi:hypothetical protein